MAETRQHRELKEIAASAALAEGWSAEFEVPGTTPLGKRWIADVLLAKDGKHVAVEVQWSKQNHARYLERQETYAAAGITVVWMHRNTRLLPTAEVMEGRVSESSNGGYDVFLEGYPGQMLSAHAFVSAALNETLRFGLRQNDPINVYIMSAEAECWADDCDCRYNMIPSLFITVGNPKYSDPKEGKLNVSLATIGKFPDARATLLKTLADLGGWDHVRDRYSRTMESSYLSCGCPRCDRVFGNFYAFPYIYDAEPVGVFAASVAQLVYQGDFHGPDEKRMWIAW